MNTQTPAELLAAAINVAATTPGIGLTISEDAVLPTVAVPTTSVDTVTVKVNGNEYFVPAKPGYTVADVAQVLAQNEEVSTAGFDWSRGGVSLSLSDTVAAQQVLTAAPAARSLG